MHVLTVFRGWYSIFSYKCIKPKAKEKQAIENTIFHEECTTICNWNYGSASGLCRFCPGGSGALPESVRDLRLEMRTTYALYADDRLCRRGLRLIDWSRHQEGFLNSSYPAPEWAASSGVQTTYEPVCRRKRNGSLTAVQTRIVEVKQANPCFVVKRISQLLRRIFLVRASAETVRRTLHKTQMMPVVKRKPQRNPSKPHFFERSTPNQMWQSDIFPFHLSGQMAYLIAVPPPSLSVTRKGAADSIPGQREVFG